MAMIDVEHPKDDLTVQVSCLGLRVGGHLALCVPIISSTAWTLEIWAQRQQHDCWHWYYWQIWFFLCFV